MPRLVLPPTARTGRRPTRRLFAARAAGAALAGLVGVLPPAARPASAQAPARLTVARDGAYVPARGPAWERRAPSAVGMDSAGLAAAVAFAVANASRAPRDLEEAHFRSFGREPYGEPAGPFAERGAPTGVILRNGYVVAEWGEPDRVDMTFSVTKSFLSTVVGLAFDRGLIRSLDDRVGTYVPTVVALPAGTRGERAGTGAPGPGAATLLRPFATPHNATITWDHLLRQTSDWEGTLWGKPEWADRPSGDPATWRTRARLTPGSAYEYNDVRVNVLALAATAVWRRPLPAVLRELVMDPIGASPTWQWVGYDNAWVLVDGQAVQSVPGGGHWGGGMFISAWDLARFGLLTARGGRWGARQVVSEAWVRRARTPTPAQPTYGFMNWFLNTDRKFLPNAPAEAFAHVGNGTNVVYVDPERDLVAVVRWIENAAVDGFAQRLTAAVRGGPAPR